MKKVNIQGFTLVEMMITIAIIGILATMAVPSFQSLIINNRLATQANDLAVDLALARSEAVKRGTRISICGSSNGTACADNAWSSGRIIFTDTGVAGSIDGTDTVIRVREGLKSGVTLGGPSAPVKYIQYLATGEVASSGTFLLCKIGINGRQIDIAATGRVRTEKMTTACS